MSGPDPVVVAAYWTVFAAATGTTGPPDDVYGFGETDEEVDRVARLVLAGTKRATVGPVHEYADLGLSPAVGDHVVVLRGDHHPVGVVRTTEVRVGPMSSVDDAFARDHGEGDRTRDWWLEHHREYLVRTYLAEGRDPDDDPDLVFQRFALVWPPEASGVTG